MKQASAGKIRYRYGGEGFDGRRRTLLFVHGAGGNGAFWFKQLDYFADRWNALAIDLPGHTDRGGPGRDNIEAYVEDVKALADGLGLKRLVLGGLSMGGAVTQQFVLTYPEMIEAALLISTGAKLAVLPAIFETVRRDFLSYVKMSEQFSISKSTRVELIEPVLAELRQQDPEVVFHDFEACNKFDIRQRLGEIKARVLIISGLDDQLTPARYHEYLHQNISGAQMVKIEKAGHMVPVEQADLVNKAIGEFLEKLEKEGQ